MLLRGVSSSRKSRRPTQSEHFFLYLFFSAKIPIEQGKKSESTSEKRTQLFFFSLSLLSMDDGSREPLPGLSVPRLDFSGIRDDRETPTPPQSETQLAMKEAIEGELGIDVGGKSTEMRPSSTTSTSVSSASAAATSSDDGAPGPSTPTRAHLEPHESLPRENCAICTGSLGENGGTLSLLCGEKKTN